MDIEVDFLSVLIDLGLAKRKRPTGNYDCPFCGRTSLKIYPDKKGHCHACEWDGDAIKLYQDSQNVSRHQACQDLGVAWATDRIKFTPQTYEEAKEELARDLEFLAWLRMYLAFYDRPDRIDRKMLADKAGISEGELSKTINGRVGNAKSWRKTLNVLRLDIPLKKFKEDLGLGIKYFEELIESEKMGSVVKKYQIKDKKQPG